MALYKSVYYIIIIIVKAPKSSHITPILRSLHWLKITERIKYKLLSLTCKVFTTTQPSYLHKLITVQPPRSTRSSSLVTLARPSTSSSVRITDRSFQYLGVILRAEPGRPYEQLPICLPSSMLPLVSGTDFRLPSVNHALTSPIRKNGLL